MKFGVEYLKTNLTHCVKSLVKDYSKLFNCCSTTLFLYSLICREQLQSSLLIALRHPSYEWFDAFIQDVQSSHCIKLKQNC